MGVARCTQIKDYTISSNTQVPYNDRTSTLTTTTETCSSYSQTDTINIKPSLSKLATALEEWKCPVCFAAVSELATEEVRVLNCGHILCDTCHMALVRHGSVCPTLVVTLRRSVFDIITADSTTVQNTSIAYACPLCRVVSVTATVPIMRVN